MAAWRDLEARVMRLGGTALYFGQAPKWLANAGRAAHAGPVILNVKGVPVDSTIVLTTLVEFERLAGTKSALDGASDAELAILAPDRVDGER